MPTVLLATYLLTINSIWDLITGTAIFVFLRTGHLRRLADTHLSLWISDEDRDNKNCSVLIAFLILQWAAIRFFCALDPVNRWLEATSTYWIEGVMVGVAAMLGKLHAFPAIAVTVLCIACAGVTVSVGIERS